MKKIFAAFIILFLATEAVNAQRGLRANRNPYYAEGVDQSVIKELQREILEGVNHGRQSRQLTGKEAKRILNQYRRITSREIKLYKKRRISERKLTQIRTDLDNLIQELYASIRFEKNMKGGWVRARR